MKKGFDGENVALISENLACICNSICSKGKHLYIYLLNCTRQNENRERLVVYSKPLRKHITGKQP